MTVELTDRELDGWVAEHVMRWTEEDEYVFVEDVEGGTRELLAYDEPLRGQEPRGTCRTWSPTNNLNACAQAEVKINEDWKLSQAYTWSLMKALKTHMGMTDRPASPFAFSWSGLELVRSATARQRCEALWLIREQIKEAGGED